jgi:hypothetical protein
MKPCEELKTIVLKHYGKFSAEGLLEPIRETYSLQEGVTIIGNDPDEWYADRESVLAFILAGSGSKLEIELDDLVCLLRRQRGLDGRPGQGQAATWQGHPRAAYPYFPSR